MEKYKWWCTVCGKTAGGKNAGTNKNNMRMHIESHIEGPSYPCNQCENFSRYGNVTYGNLIIV